MKELYIDAGLAMTSLGVLQDNELVKLYVDDAHDSSISGNIYKGRVENIVPGLNAAFLNIGLKKNAFLQLSGIIPEGLKRGDELLVQVIREESGEKGPRVTDRLSMPGKSCVLLINEKSINISSKIRNGEKRQELQSLGEKLTSQGFGVIFRTEAFDYSLEDIQKEYESLREKWMCSERTSAFLKPPCLIYDDKDITGLAVREYIKKDIEAVHINSRKLYDRLYGLCRAQGIDVKLELNEDPGAYSLLHKRISEYAGRRIDLPSGGFVVVDKTEALVAFDVNTGNFAGSSHKEDTVLKTNLEACRAVARTIRINNYSGIILIDLIDMDQTENQSLVIDEMNRAMAEDTARHKVYGLTSLGLLEISRERKGKCLRDVMYTQSVNEEPSVAALLKSLEEECNKRKLYYHESSITVKLGSDAMRQVQEKYTDFFENLQSLLNVTVKTVADDKVKGFEIVKA